MERKGPVDLSTSKVISDTFFVSISRIGILLLKPIRGIVLGRILGPSLYGSIPEAARLTVGEATPLLYPSGLYSLPVATWNYFTTGFLVALISLALILYSVIKERKADKTLILVWSVIMLAAMLEQRRFAYYFAANVAVLAGYLSARVIEWSTPKHPPGAEEAEGEEEAVSVPARAWLMHLLVVCGLILVLLLPNLQKSMALAEDPMGPAAIGEDWHSSLEWMRNSTPDPFQDPDFYYALYESPAPGQSYRYPDSAYGVMSWWDYGHWIMRIAHRIPNANPHQEGAVSAARFFLSQDESQANAMLDELGSKYVILDLEMATSKFNAMAVFAGESLTRFSETYYQSVAEGTLLPVEVYYPDYYRSICSRLYTFGGQAVVPANSTWVISYSENTDEGGNSYKEISASRLFPTYEEAKTYLERQEGPDHAIAGFSPFLSPVPLDRLMSYQLAHESGSTVVQMGNESISYVRIFEHGGGEDSSPLSWAGTSIEQPR